jgi:O-antigen/teichoic acid export membrane protein
LSTSGAVRQRSMSWYALAYAGTGIAQKGLSFLLAMWLARTLSKEQYAHFGLLFALQSGLTAFAMAGIVEVVISFLNTHRDAASRARLYRGANSVFLTLSAVLVVVATLVYAVYLRGTGIGPLPFACVLVGALLAAQFLVQSSLVRLEERHGDAIVFVFWAPMAGVAGAACAFALRPAVDSYFFGFAAASLLVLLAARMRGIGHFAIATDVAEITPLRRSIAPYIAVAVLAWASGYGNVWVVEAIFTPAQVAEFAFAYTLSSILQLAANAMNQVWSPRFFKIVDTVPAAEIEAQNVKFYRMQGGLLGAVAAAFLAVLPYAQQLIGGNLSSYHVTGGLAWLFAGYAVTIPWWHAQNYFLFKGEGSRLMRIVLATTVGGMIAWIGAMFIFGTGGIYVGFFLLMALRSAAIWLVARRLWSIRLAWQGPLLACALIALPLLAGM